MLIYTLYVKKIRKKADGGQLLRHLDERSIFVFVVDYLLFSVRTHKYLLTVFIPRTRLPSVPVSMTAIYRSFVVWLQSRLELDLYFYVVKCDQLIYRAGANSWWVSRGVLIETNK